MSLAERADLVARLSLDSRDFETGLKSTTRSLNSFSNTTIKKVGTDLGHGVRRASQNIERLALAGAALAVGGGAAAVKWAGDFQAGMNTINSVALVKNMSELDKAGEGIRKTFRETGQSMEDLQAAEYDLVSAGIKLADSQKGVDTAVRLGIGALGTTSQAVDVLTTAINAYGLKAKDGSVATATWTRLSDELAQAVADGKTKLDAIAGSYAQVAPLAAQYGVSTGEIAAAFGYLTAKGNPAAETATQMSRAILELVKPSKDMASVLKSLGVNGKQLISKYGLSGGLEIIRQRAEKLHTPFQNLFGRVEGLRYALQVTGANANGFADEMDRIAHSAGMTNKQFDARAQGLNYNLGILKANVQDAGITIGTALLPKITEMAQKAADFLRGHQGEITQFAKSLADGFSAAAEYASQIDWDGVLQAVKGVANVGMAIGKGFLAMPTEAKELILGLYGLNKLSGGAVVNVGVDLTKGLVGQFFARGAPGNPMYVVPVGGGLGSGPGGGPGGGGGLLTAIGLGLTVAGLAEAIREAMALHDAGPEAARAQYQQNPMPQFGPRSSSNLVQTHVTDNSAGSPDDRGAGAAGLKVSERMEAASISLAAAAATLATKAGLDEQIRQNQQAIASDRAENRRTQLNTPTQTLDWKPTSTIQVEDRRVASSNDWVAARTEALREAFIGRQDTANANLAKIADKRESINVQTTNRITVPVSVSVRDYNHASYTKASVSNGVTNKMSYVRQES